jgi:hypothetical protein
MSDETIFRGRRSQPEIQIRSMPPIKQGGLVMLLHIISVLYRQACRQYLIAIRRQLHRSKVATAS